jgi:hypothetical protein
MDAAERLLAGRAGGRLELIPESFQRLTGRPLLGAGKGLWKAPVVVLAHGTEADPVFFYGNRMALELFETTAEAHIRTPSRLSAEPLARDERARLLVRVTRHGFIDDYSGVRVSATGRRFRIERATVWNLVDANGELHGQAATFSTWTRLA